MNPPPPKAETANVELCPICGARAPYHLGGCASWFQGKTVETPKAETETPIIEPHTQREICPHCGEYVEDCLCQLRKLQAENADLSASLTAALDALRLVQKKWTFNNNQQHTHTWHDWADCIVAVRDALASAPPRPSMVPRSVADELAKALEKAYCEQDCSSGEGGYVFGKPKGHEVPCWKCKALAAYHQATEHQTD